MRLSVEESEVFQQALAADRAAQDQGTKEPSPLLTVMRRHRPTFYTNQTLTPWQNGLAITVDYPSAATVLGTTGLIAVSGFDAVLLACSTVVGLAVLMLLIAEPLRKAGRYTAADALARRFPARSLRLAMSTVTLAVCLPYLVLQLSRR